MLIVMKSGHSAENLKTVTDKISGMGFRATVIPGDHSVAVGVTGNKNALDPELFNSLPGVQEAIRVTKSYKLASREFKTGSTQIKVGGATFGAGHFTVIAGPCAVESEEQTLRIARAVKAGGAHVLRGGAYKPRTSPYSFQGMGVEGLKILEKARKETGLPFVTEATDLQSLEFVGEYADIVQIGARNMQNFALLQEAGKLRKPIMLKRGLSATIEEWLLAAEYIMDQGNEQVILCERGVRSFDPQTRNMLDVAAVPVLQALSHLPVVVDPSHGTGKRDMILPLSRASLAVGAQGVMMDVHDRPNEALCDGPQAIHPDEFKKLVTILKALAKTLEVTLN